jgi:glycosyltransferase involved in cell wall biosynthesis
LKGFDDKLKEIEPDVFNPHHPIPFISDKTIFFAKKNGIPSVLTYHADSAYDTLLSKIAAEIYYTLIGRRMARSADAIVSDTRSYAETSPVLKHYMNKVNVIPIGIDTNRFNMNIRDKIGIRERYKLKDKFIILAIGRFVPYKGYRYLIESMKYLDDTYTLILYGWGILENSLKKLAKKLGVEKRVIFTGFVKDIEKTSFYAACDVFCVPSISRGECYSITLLEAIACGKPVIASNIPGVNEVASIGEGQLVEPKNPEDLAKAIKKSREIKINRNKIDQKIKSEFSWEKIVKKYISVYKELG